MDATDKPPSTLVHGECRRDESLHCRARAPESDGRAAPASERTTAIDVADVGRWLPSLLVRRLEKLELTVGSAG
jgi:hypothetical protein